MKGTVWRELYIDRIIHIILVNMMFLPMIAWLGFLVVWRDQTNLVFGWLFVISCVLYLDISFATKIWQDGSVVSFEEDHVHCCFNKKTKRLIKYDEVKEYGTCIKITRRPAMVKKFIYVSRLELTDNQRGENDVAMLFAKTKDVILAPYGDALMDVVKEKVPKDAQAYYVNLNNEKRNQNN